MTNREIYFKYFLINDVNFGHIDYTIKDENNNFHIEYTPLFEFSFDEKIIKKSLRIMDKIQEKKNFVFWNISEEGEQFLENVLNDIISENFTINEL